MTRQPRETALAPLGRERYANLATYRRDGHEVRTPIWLVGLGDRIYAFTNGGSGKVKRLRANARVRIAPCDIRGKVRGEWVEATARIATDPASIEAAYAALRAKYGWQMWLTDVGSKLRGLFPHRVVIEIEPPGG